MKTVTYQTKDGPLTLEYDPDAPCIGCGYPVKEASMGGTAVCPWCDCGHERPEVIAERTRDAAVEFFIDLVHAGRRP